VTKLAEIIRWVQLAEWTLLAAAAVNLWRRNRSPSATWLALTFGSIAVVVVAGFALPEDPTALTLALRLLLAVLALFPYLLYRFVTSMVARRRWAWIAAHVLTAGSIVGSFLIPSLPQPGEARTPGFTILLIAFLAQWGFLLMRVSWLLWRAGSAGQPVVARKRMRTMAVGASMLVLILVASGAGSSGAQDGPIDIALSALGLIAAPLFFLGFDPPRTLRLVWRQREEADLRTAEIGLVRAVSRTEVASAWLPRVSELVGGQGAVIFDMDETVLAAHNFPDGEVAHARDLLPPADSARYDAVEVGPYRVVTMHNGWLVVSIGALTPFFGDDELRMLGASSVVADLALGRARLFELERQAGEAMRDFVAIASHDLRTPVTVIAGFTDLMQMQWNTVTDEEKQDYLRAIARQVTHLSRLIDDLLTVSKLDVRELDVFRQPVDVERIAHEVVEELGNEATVIVAGAAAHVRAWADSDHVSRMIRNYLANAKTYGRAPISVEIGREDSSVVVRVRDAGSGVPADFVGNLFEKFARLDKKKSKAVGGTGLGLSIVRGLATNNGGDAWYEPNEPAGSVFCVRLPLAAPSHETAHA
jgi:signal transduction histidine kinase